MPSDRLPLQEEVDKIRRDGESHATWESLLVSCEDQGSFTYQLDRITDVAQHVGRSFPFFVDVSVRFTSLTGPTEPVQASRAVTDERCR